MKRHFLLLAASFSAALAVLVALSYLGFVALSSARAYVNGEAQWTKAQKQAVIRAFEYARTGDRDSLAAFDDAIRVTLGDRQARLELESENPDKDVARAGFRQGRIPEQDIGLLIRFFEYGRYFPAFEAAVEEWRQADKLVDRLIEAVDELEAVVASAGAGVPATEPVLGRVAEIDSRLTTVESRFSAHIARLSRQLTTGLLVAILVAAALVLTAGNLLARRLLRSAVAYEHALASSERRHRALVNQTQVGMWQLDAAGCIVYLNPAMRKLLGLGQSEQLEDARLEQFVSSADRESMQAQKEYWERGLPTDAEVEVAAQDGERRQLLFHGARIITNRDTVSGYVGTCVDISDRKRAEQQLRHQAYHDALTGLPNRRYFLQRLEEAFERTRHGGTTLAVLFIDLDRFKVVNDSVGHGAGDQVLVEAGLRIREAVRGEDAIARLGGDEFGIIVEGVGHVGQATAVADRVMDALARNSALRDYDVHVGATIGIAMPLSEADRPSDLLRYADIAMYAGKRVSGGCWHVYDPHRDAPEAERLQRENELWQAVQNEQFIVHYQPIVNCNDDRVVAMEALVRWEHPRRGLLDPAEFVALAEETGAVSMIGRLVTAQACRDLAWARRQLSSSVPEYVSVNMSDIEFRHGKPAQWVGEVLDEAEIAAESLCFEVTETLITQDAEAIGVLSELGCRIALDDFGTGYASLGMLREVHCSAIKIDRKFVAGLLENEADAAVVEAMVSLGERLGIEVIAEGVESEQQLEALRAMGCELVQGYLFAAPEPLETLLEAWPSSRPGTSNED